MASQRLSDQCTDNQIHNNFFTMKVSGTDCNFIDVSLSNEALDSSQQEDLILGKRKRKKDELPKPKKKGFVKRFRKEWMDEPLFKGWLQPVISNPGRGFCSLCNVILIAGHSELEKHASGKKHCKLQFSSLPTISCVEDGKEFILVDQKGDVDSDNTTETVLDTSELISDRDFVYFENGTILPQNRPTAKLKFTDGLTGVKTAVSKLSLLKSLKPSGSDDGKIVATAQLIHPDPKTSALPENPDADKLLHCVNTDTEEDDDSLYELEDSAHLLREMRAELAYGEKKRNDEPFIAKTPDGRSRSPSSGRPRGLEEFQRYLAEKEMEAKLSLIEERRKQNLNIYKLKLIEMEAKIRLAEAELQRSAEIHKLRINQLRQLAQTQHREESYNADKV